MNLIDSLFAPTVPSVLEKRVDAVEVERFTGTSWFFRPIQNGNGSRGRRNR